MWMSDFFLQCLKPFLSNQIKSPTLQVGFLFMQVPYLSQIAKSVSVYESVMSESVFYSIMCYFGLVILDVTENSLYPVIY